MTQASTAIRLGTTYNCFVVNLKKKRIWYKTSDIFLDPVHCRVFAILMIGKKGHNSAPNMLQCDGSKDIAD